MSKPVKELLRKELAQRLEGVDALAVVGFTGVDAITTNQIRKRLREKHITMRVVKNSIARQTFQSVGLAPVADLLEGPCAIAFAAEGVVGVVRELLDIGKTAPNLTVKAAFMEGEIYGAERIEELSNYPTREEAIGRVVALATAPASRLAGCLVGPAQMLAGALKAVEEKAKASPEAA